MKKKSMLQKRRGAAVLLVALTALWLPPAAADTHGHGQTTSHTGCHSALKFVSIPKENVQIRDGDPSNDRVPERYTLVGEGGDGASLLIDSFACEEVSGPGWTAGPVTGAWISIEICPRDGSDCMEKVDTYAYLLFVITDSQDYAEWYRAGTGIDAIYVENISRDFTCPPQPCTTSTYFFEVSEGPVPFKVEGVLGAQDAFGVCRGYGGWIRDTGHRTGVLQYRPHENFFASGQEVITAPEGTELADIMGTTIAKPVLSLPHWTPDFVLERQVTPLGGPREVPTNPEGCL